MRLWTGRQWRSLRGRESECESGHCALYVLKSSDQLGVDSDMEHVAVVQLAGH